MPRSQRPKARPSASISVRSQVRGSFAIDAGGERRREAGDAVHVSSKDERPGASKNSGKKAVL